MSKPMRVLWLPQARDAWHRLSTAQRDQVRRLLAAIRIAPMVGAFVRYDLDGRVLRIVSAADTHLVYTITYHFGTDDLFVVDVFVAEWTPRHIDEP